MSLVTVEDESISDHFFFKRLPEGFGHQLDRGARPEAIGHDEPIIKIFDRAQRGPALLGADVGHICDPFLVGPLRREVPVEQVGIAVQLVHHVPFGSWLALPRHRANPHPVHQPQNSLVIDRDPFVLLDPHLHPPIAVDPVRGLVGFSDQCHPETIPVGLPHPFAPGVVAGSR